MSADMGQFDARKTTLSSKEAQDQVFAKFKQRRVSEMKVKTNELTGAALDWAVAKCEGLMQGQIAIDGVTHGFYKPSTDWAQGGPIIEREGICVFLRSPHWPKNNRWSARQENDASLGPTPLIAAMRYYVASKLGDEVEIPEGLE